MQNERDRISKRTPTLEETMIGHSGLSVKALLNAEVFSRQVEVRKFFIYIKDTSISLLFLRLKEIMGMMLV